MALIDEIVKISVTKQDAGIKRRGFGTALILGNSVDGLDPQVKSYGSLTEIAVDFQVQSTEYLAATRLFAQQFKPEKVLIGQKAQADATFVAAYNNIKLITEDFHAVLQVAGDNASKLAVSEAVNADKRLYFASTEEDGVLTDADGNLLKLLNAANHARSVVMYTSHADEDFPVAAWVGRMLPTDPGSGTWAYKNLSLVRADNLTTAQRTAIKTRHGNFYSNFGGSDVSLFGTTVTGEYIDIIWGLDWLESYMKENVASAILANEKIPYNRQGLSIVENAIRGSLEEAVTRSVINTGYTIEMPDFDTISVQDKSERVLRNIKVRVTLTGAIHAVEIEIIATY